MTEKPGPQVYILRSGAARQRVGEARVRWVYAIQCGDEDALRQAFERLGAADAIGPQDLQDLLTLLPVQKVLAGAGEIQAAARHDAGLRRALRAARESLRGEDKEGGATKSRTERDKGAV